MADRLSPRLAAVVDALPLWPTARVLEIGCGPGAAARAVADRLTAGHLLAVDRSNRAVALASRTCADLVTAGRVSIRQVAAEELVLLEHEQPYDLVFAVRVGALDGGHPAAGALSLPRIAAVTTPSARLFVDGGAPLREITIPR